MGVVMDSDAGKCTEEPEEIAFRNVEPLNLWDPVRPNSLNTHKFAGTDGPSSQPPLVASLVLVCDFS